VVRCIPIPLPAASAPTAPTTPTDYYYDDDCVGGNGDCHCPKYTHYSQSSSACLAPRIFRAFVPKVTTLKSFLRL